MRRKIMVGTHTVGWPLVTLGVHIQPFFLGLVRPTADSVQRWTEVCCQRESSENTRGDGEQ